MINDMLTQLKEGNDKAKFHFKNGSSRVGRVLDFDDHQIQLIAEQNNINISELSRIEVVDEKENLKTANRLEMTRKAKSIEQGFER